MCHLYPTDPVCQCKKTELDTSTPQLAVSVVVASSIIMATHTSTPSSVGQEEQGNKTETETDSTHQKDNKQRIQDNRKRSTYYSNKHTHHLELVTSRLSPIILNLLNSLILTFFFIVSAMVMTRVISNSIALCCCLWYALLRMRL